MTIWLGDSESAQPRSLFTTEDAEDTEELLRVLCALCCKSAADWMGSL